MRFRWNMAALLLLVVAFAAPRPGRAMDEREGNHSKKKPRKHHNTARSGLPPSEERQLIDLVYADLTTHAKPQPLQLHISRDLFQLPWHREFGQANDWLAKDLGVILPWTEIIQNSNLPKGRYQMSHREVKFGGGTIDPKRLIAFPKDGESHGDLQGEAFVDPVWQQKAFWIDPKDSENWIQTGHEIFRPGELVANHLAHSFYLDAGRFYNLEETKKLIRFHAHRREVLSQINPNEVKLGTFHGVLRRLLEEHVPVHNLEAIVGTLLEYTPHVSNLESLTEAVRQQLAPEITKRFSLGYETISAIGMNQDLQDRIAFATDVTDTGVNVRIPPHESAALAKHISEIPERILHAPGYSPILIVRPDVRQGLRRMLKDYPDIMYVLSENEIDRKQAQPEYLHEIDEIPAEDGTSMPPAK